MKVAHLTTIGITLRFLAGHMRHLLQQGHQVLAISNPDAELASHGVETRGIPMERKIAPFADLRSLTQLVRLFRNETPDIVHAHSPKGALLGCIAARLARVPLVIFHVHGLPYLEGAGLRASILKFCTWLTCQCAHEIWCVSASIREVLIADGFALSSKVLVPGAGSICGVDADNRFVPQARPEGRPFTVLFAGRLANDKGVEEVTTAWEQLRLSLPDAQLKIAGEMDERDGCSLERLQAAGHVEFLGWQEDMAAVYAQADLLWLPSHREGFGMVLLEAAAMRLPTIAADIPGCRDAVVDGKTGTLIPVRAPEALAAATLRYAQSPQLRAEHGTNGRNRVLNEFQPSKLHEAFVTHYRQQLLSRSVRSATKRAIDIAVSGTVLLLAAPILAVVAIAVRINMGSPVLFRQTRPGLGGEPFEMLKFRTMRDACDRKGNPLPDGDRLTALGTFLRRTSLDELPELWNVLRGQMSLVGPRPLLLRYTPFFTERERLRFLARPGITGWAQIQGRNYLGWDERLGKDVWYVENWSVLLDCKILVRTALEVFRQSGIAVDANTVMRDLNVERSSGKEASHA